MEKGGYGKSGRGEGEYTGLVHELGRQMGAGRWGEQAYPVNTGICLT